MNPNTAAHPEQYKKASAAREVAIHQSDLPVFCPRADETLWNAHPRVYIHLEKKGDQARCIYCGTLYRLID
ncbi:zinc-finger domain-containing protein [Halothiobacillus sp.]|uniref:zinc-finger domain-containing protein n=1 Tax=Halothiobacillus sp. TaxID=1891311 RepID=UPI002633744D|nr:zinc-finger domain-containing protein [Halothiobacillus sp.]